MNPIYPLIACCLVLVGIYAYSKYYQSKYRGPQVVSYTSLLIKDVPYSQDQLLLKVINCLSIITVPRAIRVSVPKSSEAVCVLNTWLAKSLDTDSVIDTDAILAGYDHGVRYGVLGLRICNIEETKSEIIVVFDYEAIVAALPFSFDGTLPTLGSEFDI